MSGTPNGIIFSIENYDKTGVYVGRLNGTIKSISNHERCRCLTTRAIDDCKTEFLFQGREIMFYIKGINVEYSMTPLAEGVRYIRIYDPVFLDYFREMEESLKINLIEKDDENRDLIKIPISKIKLYDTKRRLKKTYVVEPTRWTPVLEQVLTERYLFGKIRHIYFRLYQVSGKAIIEVDHLTVDPKE